MKRTCGLSRWQTLSAGSVSSPWLRWRGRCRGGAVDAAPAGKPRRRPSPKATKISTSRSSWSWRTMRRMASDPQWMEGELERHQPSIRVNKVWLETYRMASKRRRPMCGRSRVFTSKGIETSGGLMCRNWAGPATTSPASATRTRTIAEQSARSWPTRPASSTKSFSDDLWIFNCRCELLPEGQGRP